MYSFFSHKDKIGEKRALQVHGWIWEHPFVWLTALALPPSCMFRSWSQVQFVSSWVERTNVTCTPRPLRVQADTDTGQILRYRSRDNQVSKQTDIWTEGTGKYRSNMGRIRTCRLAGRDTKPWKLLKTCLSQNQAHHRSVSQNRTEKLSYKSHWLRNQGGKIPT